MSLTAVLVLAVVVIVLLVGWLAVVFLAARSPAPEPSPGAEDASDAADPEAGPHSQAGHASPPA